MEILYLFFILFYFYLSYDIIPIKNFEKIVVPITSANNLSILSYFHYGSSNLIKYTHRIRNFVYPYSRINFNFYLYENISQIKRNEYGEFINYNLTDIIYGNGIIEFEDEHQFDKEYFFVLQNWEKLKEDFKLIIEVFSTETPFILSHMVEEYIRITSPAKKIVYIFQIPPEHEKYILFSYFEYGFGTSSNLEIYENGEKVIYSRSQRLYESYLELKNGCNYTIKLTIYQSSLFTDYKQNYFYFVLSKFIGIFPVEINTEYFNNYRTTKDLYLLLNMSTIETHNIMMIEYGQEYKKQHNITIFSYNTEDEDIVSKSAGKELEFIKSEKDKDNIFRSFILKDSEKIKFIILKVNYTYYGYSEGFFRIKYGEQEKYLPNTIYIKNQIDITVNVFLKRIGVIISQILKLRKELEGCSRTSGLQLSVFCMFPSST